MDKPRSQNRLARLARLAAAIAAASAVLASSPVLAAPNATKPLATVDMFTQAPWSQSRPSRDYLHGCVTGYLSFVFDRNGRFVFNQRVHGVWRLDPLGNLQLTVTGSNARTSLMFDGVSTLTSERTTPFLQRETQFTQCKQ